MKLSINVPVVRTIGYRTTTTVLFADPRYPASTYQDVNKLGFEPVTIFDYDFKAAHRTKHAGRAALLASAGIVVAPFAYGSAALTVTARAFETFAYGVGGFLRSVLDRAGVLDDMDTVVQGVKAHLAEVFS